MKNISVPAAVITALVMLLGFGVVVYVRGGPTDTKPSMSPDERVAAIAAARNRSSYSELSERDFALLVKDPDATAGRKVIVYGDVFQFDAATGTDGFQAWAAEAPASATYLSGENVTVVAGTADLRNVVEDDLVKMYVEVIGSHTYETQDGAERTTPLFRVNVIDVILPAEQE